MVYREDKRDTKLYGVARRGKARLFVKPFCGEQKPMPKKISRTERVAYHEAGHAVLMHQLGIAIREVSIILNDGEGSLGYVSAYSHPSFRPDTDSPSQTRGRVEKEIIVLFAGVIAESLFCGRYSWRGANSDLVEAANLARYIASEEEELKAWLKLLKIRTRNQLREPFVWAKVEAVAKALISRKRLRGKEVKQIIVDRNTKAVEEGWESLPHPPTC